MRRPTLLAAATLLAVAGGCGSGPDASGPAQVRTNDHLSATPPTSGNYIADSGFRPDPNGFSFPNYGDEPQVAELGAAEVVELFGQQACLSADGTACRLGSPATTWLQVMNGLASGGHCEGMAVLSQAFALGAESPSAYGADTTYALPFEGNSTLQRDIARWFSTQATEPTQSAETRGASPNDILDTLIETLPQPRTPENTYTLGIFQPEFVGGHAITPMAVEDRGDGIVWILVYDNNFPGQTRAIAVDRESNSWSYLASTNPDQPEAVYAGDATTGTLTLTPLAPRLTTQQCPFCRGELDQDVAAAGTNQFSLTGSAAQQRTTDFYLTDAAGQRFGRVGGDVVREIPDGTIVPIAQGPGLAPAPIVELPAALDTTVTIGSREPSTALNFAMIGAGYDVFIEGVNAPSDQPATVQLAADGSRVSFTQGAADGPNLSAAVANSAGWNFDLTLDIVQMAAEGSTITLASPDDTADVVIGSATAGRYALTIDVAGPDNSERQLSVAEFSLLADQQLVLGFEQWQGSGALAADVIDSNGDVVSNVTVAETTLPVPRPAT